MTDYIFQWSGTAGKVLSDNMIFEIAGEKPALGFAYDSLLLETPTAISFKILDGNQLPLTAAEISAVKAYCDAFASTADYEVWAYDADDGLFIGKMLKSAAITAGNGYCLEEPTTELCKRQDGAWVACVRGILDDGRLVPLDGLSACPRCALLLTATEWDGFAHPERESDTWNFVTECWEDLRDIAKVKHEAALTVRNQFEALRWKVMQSFVPQYEQDTWRVQLDEARAWTVDNAAPTPYMDTFLTARTDAGKPDKPALAADIIANNDAYVVAMAQVNAEQWGYLAQVKSAASCAAVDEILSSMTANIRARL